MAGIPGLLRASDGARMCKETAAATKHAEYRDARENASLATRPARAINAMTAGHYGGVEPSDSDTVTLFTHLGMGGIA